MTTWNFLTNHGRALLCIGAHPIRSTAAGFCFNFGRVGAIAGIKLVPVLIPLIGFTTTYCIASIAYVTAAILVFTLRETQGIQLTSGN